MNMNTMKEQATMCRMLADRLEEYYGVEIDYMSRNQLLTVVAKLIDVTEGE